MADAQILTNIKEVNTQSSSSKGKEVLLKFFLYNPFPLEQYSLTFRSFVFSTFYSFVLLPDILHCSHSLPHHTFFISLYYFSVLVLSLLWPPSPPPPLLPQYTVAIICYRPSFLCHQCTDFLCPSTHPCYNGMNTFAKSHSDFTNT